MAKFDVLVPCYNYARYLTDCVRSVLDQSVRDVRVLLIDDASSDDSVDVASRLAAADRRVAFISHARNRGHIATYNEGIEWADSDYFLLLSADDMLVAGALERAAAVMDADPSIGLTYGRCIPWFEGHPKPIIEAQESYSWASHDLLTEICTEAINLVPTPTAIVRTSVQKAVGGYRTSLPHAGDMEMWLRFAANGPTGRIDAVQAIYRKHSTAMSNAYFAEMLSDYRQCQLAFEVFFDEYEDRLADSSILRRVASRALAERVFRRGIGLIRRGHFNDGIRLIRGAMDMDRRLRYFPPIWQLLRIPGPAGREWARSVLGDALARSPKQKRRAF
jgi:GT2 family glycosyltransferase